MIGPAQQVCSSLHTNLLDFHSSSSCFFFTLCHFFQGILLEHREKEFGDKVNMLAVLRAARQIQDNMSS